MSEATIILNRKILASFLPNHEAVKAFEAVIRSVEDTTPASIDELTLLTLQQRRGREDIITNKINDLLLIMENIQATLDRKQNTTLLEARIKALEEMIGV